MSFGTPRWLRAPAARLLAAAGLVTLLVAACRQPEDQDESFNPGTVAGGSGGTANLDSSAGTLTSSAGVGTGDGDGQAAAAQGGGSGEQGGASGVAEGGADGELPAAGGACGSDADDGACASCLQAQCCTEWQACELDDDCRACTACLDNQLDLGECVVMDLCDIAPQATADILLCGLEPCVMQCGFD